MVASGGHTSIYLVKDFSSYKILGQTQDDAVGEAFDKVAKILNLGYPGGPIIERFEKKGNALSVRFSCERLKDSLDFSFSGIKTAVFYYTRKSRRNTKREKQNIAASFQKSVVDILINKAQKACLIN